MGYKSRIYFVHKTHAYDEEKRPWAEVLGMLNLSKLGSYGDTLRTGKPDCFSRETDCYLYHSNGNTVLLEDAYGDRLAECDPVDFLAWLDNRMKIDKSGYQRYYMAKALTEHFVDHSGWPPGYITVLHEGY